MWRVSARAADSAIAGRLDDCFTVTAPRSSSGLKKRRFRILPWDVDDILAPLLLGVIGSRSVGFRLNHLPLGNILVKNMSMLDDKEKIDTCSVKGRVVTVGLVGDFFVLGYPGIGLNVDIFINLDSGQIGFFSSVEFGIGLDVSAGINVGTAPSAAALNGLSLFASGSYFLGEGEVAVALNDFGEANGVTVSGGASLSPLPAAGSIGGSVGGAVCLS